MTTTTQYTFQPPTQRLGFYENRVLPRIIDRLLGSEAATEARARTCAGLEGEVVDVGFGTGTNLAHLPPAVTRVHAIEPSIGALERAAAAIDASPVPVDISGRDGQRLPFPDESVDRVLFTWTLCTIPDPVAAIREARRVLRVGGAVHFVEHGLSDVTSTQRWQHRLNGLQNRLFCGCNLTRDVPDLLARGGLPAQQLDAYTVPSEPGIFARAYEGIATKVGAP
jgi:SAM-dependent methyltransferase